MSCETISAKIRSATGDEADALAKELGSNRMEIMDAAVLDLKRRSRRRKMQALAQVRAIRPAPPYPRTGRGNHKLNPDARSATQAA